MRIGTLIFAAMAMLTVQCTGPGVEPPVPPTPQPPPPPPPVEEVFVIAKTEYNISRAGGTVRVEVETNTEYTFEIDPNADWVNEAEEEKASTRRVSSDVLYFTVSANDTQDSREAAIIFTTASTAEEVVIRQNREDEFSVIGEYSHNFGELGGSFELEVRHNVDFEITFQSSIEEGSWITTANSTHTPPTTILRFDVAQNTDPISRLGYITISGGVEEELQKTIMVGQKGRESPAIYASTDYSADGRTTLLQEAGEGAGIDVVIMGDAFTDRLIADGTYAGITRTAMEHLFSEEPYKSFRRLFDVRAVDVVSKNEVYSPNHETALGGVVETNGWGVVTNMSGDDETSVRNMHERPSTPAPTSTTC